MEHVPRKKIRTTKADKKATYSPDLVNRSFHAEDLDQLLVSDLTYIDNQRRMAVFGLHFRCLFKKNLRLVNDSSHES